MVFKIGEKKANVSNYDTNIPLPLLPPPPSRSSSKNYKEASDDASSSSSESDKDDPLAIFRSKSTKNKTYQQQGKNLITDWDDETKINEGEQERVCLMFISMYLLLSCMCNKSSQGGCSLTFIRFHYSSFI
jgi:hypothetical protein